MKIEGVPGYFIIEINPRLIIIDPPKEVYDTVSHELAHCLDFKIRGFYDRKGAPDHDEFWSFLHRRMGGNGKATMDEVKSKFQLRISKPKADTITQNFDPLDITEK